jgi:2,4-dienoyl-CoA reductase-like NADH-dependent reductase (Old Yellow Enzyme family)
MNYMLFDPLQFRDVTFRNRIAVSPMCQYSSDDGFANDWHLVHLGSRAVGVAGAVIMEATAVDPRGRISPQDQGIWKDEHIAFLARIATFLKAEGAVAGIQLAHAGRKASTRSPVTQAHGLRPTLQPAEGGWTPVAPSPIPFYADDAPPAQLTQSDIRCLVESFASAARRALHAGFNLVEIHAAHGYLIHEFLSPLSNRRTDEYGGSFDNRIRFVLEVVESVRAAWPAGLPLWLRISATDWAEGGWTLDDSVELAKRVRTRGVDLIDCSSGGLTLQQKIELGPGYQVPFAARIRRESAIATGAVGMITEPEQAEQILVEGQADLVLLAREFLRDPYFPLRAARQLGAKLPPPPQYARAW